MKRLAIAALAAAALLGVSAAPVFAEDETQEVNESGNLADGGLKWTFDTLNPILKAIPAPAGWHQRHLCVWSMQANRELCLYFPWPV